MKTCGCGLDILLCFCFLQREKKPGGFVGIVLFPSLRVHILFVNGRGGSALTLTRSTVAYLIF